MERKWSSLEVQLENLRKERKWEMTYLHLHLFPLIEHCKSLFHLFFPLAFLHLSTQFPSFPFPLTQVIPSLLLTFGPFPLHIIHCSSFLPYNKFLVPLLYTLVSPFLPYCPFFPSSLSFLPAEYLLYSLSIRQVPPLFTLPFLTASLSPPTNPSFPPPPYPFTWYQLLHPCVKPGAALS